MAMLASSWSVCVVIVITIGALRLTTSYARKSQSSHAHGKYEYDYIVVGSGTSGSMVVSELAALFPDDEILLIEEGSFSRVNSEIDNLALWLNVAIDPNIDRGYSTVPQSQLNDREIALPRAKITGGCNSHNLNAYILADKMDFERWGNIPGWSVDDVMDIWDEIKVINPGEKMDETNEFIQRLLFAAQEGGYSYNSDYLDLRNGNQDGSTPLVLQATTVNDSYVRRRSSWTDFVEPLLPNENLDILILTRVNKILFNKQNQDEDEDKSSSSSSSSSSSNSNNNNNNNDDNIKAIGVETENLGTFKIQNYYATKEIIISGGTYDTPKLLMLSGIGDCNNLQSNFGIDCIKHLPGVGQNLQDHVAINMQWQFVNSNGNNDLTPIFDELSQLSSNSAWGVGAGAGIVVIANESRFINYVGPIVIDDVSINIGNFMFPCQLKSTGSVNLFDSDPNSRPIIDHTYLSDENENDINAVVEGIKLARELIEGTTAFDDYFINYNISIIELLPGNDVNTDDEIKDYVRNNVLTGNHGTSTCKMGKEYDYYYSNDTSIVVNEYLQVIGIENLRIADASIMPETVSANTNLMTMVIGKKVAKFIAQDWYF